MNYLETHKLQVSLIIILLSLLSGWRTQVFSQGIIIDHTCTDITRIPESAINQARATLHIGFGHTSHGSQLTTGMTGLVAFANNGGLGLSHPQDIFEWNDGGLNGALDLHDQAMEGDVGHYPEWVDYTRLYLGPPDLSTGRGTTNPDVNVIIWSWCGQVGVYSEQEMINEYLSPMSQLESDYPNVSFVYMTGHATGSGEEGGPHIRNQQIRNYCINNNKVLYDFYDIECYDPDGNYFGDLYVTDGCCYDYNGDGVTSWEGDPDVPLNGDRNWAIDWQNSHTEGLNWYDCDAAHTQPLNANRKAYAAWYLFAKLAGYDDTSLPVEMSRFGGVRNKNSITIQWCTASEIGCFGFHIWRKSENDSNFSRITADSDLIFGHRNSSAENEYSFIDYNIKNFHSYTYKIEELTMSGESNFHGLIVVDRNISFLDLKQNYPNPFNPQTTIEYYISKPGKTSIAIYNVLGEIINMVDEGFQDIGNYKITFSGKNYASGVYYYEIKSGDYSETKSMVLIK